MSEENPRRFAVAVQTVDRKRIFIGAFPTEELALEAAQQRLVDEQKKIAEIERRKREHKK